MIKYISFSFFIFGILATTQKAYADYSCKIQLRGKWITANFQPGNVVIKFSEIPRKKRPDTTRPTKLTGGKCPIYYTWKTGAWEFCSNGKIRRVDNHKTVGKHKCKLANVLEAS